MKQLIFISSLLYLTSINSLSSHVYGGDMRCEQIGTNKFKVIFRLIHDSIGIIDSTSAPIYENNTNSFITLVKLKKDSTRLWILKSGTTQLDSIFVSFFSDTVNLTSNLNGYYISWAHCCRINSLINIGSSGFVMTCQIPNPSLLSGNSNPVFVRYPDDLFMCVNQTKNLDFSCTDADGDSLVYSLVTPYHSSNIKPFNVVPWNLSFNINNYIGPGSLCTINTSTGVVTTRASQLGKYQVAVLCEEYRSGVKIGEVYRDVPIPAINCNLLSTNKLAQTSLNFTVHPNPCSGSLNLSTTESVLTPINITIVDFKGTVILSRSLTKISNKINTHDWPKGVYFVQLSSEKNRVIKRIIVQ